MMGHANWPTLTAGPQGARPVCPVCYRYADAYPCAGPEKAAVVLRNEDQEEAEVQPSVTTQGEAAEADKQYDSDRPHRPTQEEQERFWQEDVAARVRRDAGTDLLPSLALFGARRRALLKWHEDAEEEAPQPPEADADPTAATVGELVDRHGIASIKICHLVGSLVGGEAVQSLAKLEALHREMRGVEAALPRFTVPDASNVPDIVEKTAQLHAINETIYALEDVVKGEDDPFEVMKAAKKTRTLNRERSDLKNAITRLAQGPAARMDTKT